MDGHDYEYTVAQYLRNHGYVGVKVTQASGDYGIDVTAYKGRNKYAVQCKYYSKPVGVGAVQEAVAGMAMYNCNKAMVVTNNTFTKAAQNLAEKNNVILLDGITGGHAFRDSSKVGNTIGWILIAVFAVFYGAIINLAFEKGVKDLIEVIAVLLVLPIVLWYFANRIFKFSSLMFRTLLYFGIIAYMSFVGTNIFELNDYLSANDISGFFKALALVLIEVFGLLIFLCLPKIIRKIRDSKSSQCDRLYDEKYEEADEFGEGETTENSEKIAEIKKSESSEYNIREVLPQIEEPKSSTSVSIKEQSENTPLVDDSLINNENLERAISNWIKTVELPFENPDFSEEKYLREVEEFDSLVKKECDKVASELVGAFELFNVKVELVGNRQHPQKMIFMIKPTLGVKISAIKNSLQDVSLQLGVKAFKMTVQPEEGVIYLVTEHKYAAPSYDINYRFEENLRKVMFESIKANDCSISFIEKATNLTYTQVLNIIRFIGDNGLIREEFTSLGIDENIISEREFISRYL